MARPRSLLLVLVVLAAASAGPVLAQGPKPAATALPPLPAAPSDGAPAPAPKAEQPPATQAPTGDPALDPKAARLDAAKRLEALPAATEKTSLTPAQKSLRETLEERIKWLDAYDKAAADRRLAENPTPNPESEAADRKAELEHARAAIETAAKDAKSLLPELFQGTATSIPEAKLSEMRDAIEALRIELKDRSAEAEKLRASTGRTGSSAVSTLGASRDKVAQRTATIPARRAERETAVLGAASPEARDLARERLATFDWEARAEAERMKAVEAQISLEMKRSELLNLTIQAKEQNHRLAKLTFEEMQKRYRLLAESQQNALIVAAAGETNRASHANDLVERFRAQGKAELLELQAKLINDKKAEAASPRISLMEQTDAANRAATEFENLKALLKDDKVSSLDALQLNNDFRKVSRERNLISRNELAEASGVMAYYENLLTETELELLSDARDDRFELENLLAVLPESRHAEARAMIDRMNQEHRALLVERRAVLDKLATRARDTYAQVVRRLQTLDDQYAFVRANLFWIRDAEPVGLRTFHQARRDLRHLIPGLFKLAAEPFDRLLWSRPTVEFGLSVAAALVIPFILIYLRRAVRALA